MSYTIALKNIGFEASIIRDKLKNDSRQHVSKVCHINLSTCILSSGRIYMEGVGFEILMQLGNSKEEVEVRSIAPSVILVTAKFIPLQLRYVSAGIFTGGRDKDWGGVLVQDMVCDTTAQRVCSSTAKGTLTCKVFKLRHSRVFKRLQQYLQSLIFKIDLNCLRSKRICTRAQECMTEAFYSWERSFMSDDNNVYRSKLVHVGRD